MGWVAAFWVFLTFVAPNATAEEYRLGEGVALEGTPLYLGGYFSLDYYHDLNGSSEAAVDDLALMLYGGEGAWSGMVEVEWSDLYYRRFGISGGGAWETRPHAERVYVRYEPSESLRTTVGKFNTPVGYWNRMPINVLRDTTSSPQVVYDIFPRFTTGMDAALRYGGLSINVLLQGTRDLDAVFNGSNLYNNFDVDKGAGLGLAWDNGAWSAELNAGGYDEYNTTQKWGYAYASAQYWEGDTHIMAECGYRRNRERARSNLAAYLQLTERFLQRHYAVVRGEYVSDYLPGSEDTALILGYTYRPLFPVAFKAEYQLHSRHADDKAVFSFSVLF